MMKGLRRLDSVKILRPERTPEGFLRLWGVTAVAGTVMTYADGDGIRRERIDAAALRDSVGTLKGATLVAEHPRRPDGSGTMVDAYNFKDEVVGIVEDVSYDEGSGEQRVQILVKDASTIQRIDSGELTEISPGYLVDVIPGDSGADLVQVARQHNHLALTREGRGTNMLRVDSAGHIIGAIEAPLTEDPMTAEEKKALADALARADSLASELDAAKGARDMAIQEAADLKAEKATEEMAGQRADSFLAEFNARTAVLETAKALKIEVDQTKATGDIKRDIVAAKRGDKFRVDSSDAYVEAAYDFVVDALAEETKATPDPLGEALFKRADSADDKDNFVDPTRALVEQQRDRNNKRTEVA